VVRRGNRRFCNKGGNQARTSHKNDSRDKPTREARGKVQDAGFCNATFLLASLTSSREEAEPVLGGKDVVGGEKKRDLRGQQNTGVGGFHKEKSGEIRTARN